MRIPPRWGQRGESRHADQSPIREARPLRTRAAPPRWGQQKGSQHTDQGALCSHSPAQIDKILGTVKIIKIVGTTIMKSISLQNYKIIKMVKMNKIYRNDIFEKHLL